MQRIFWAINEALAQRLWGLKGIGATGRGQGHAAAAQARQAGMRGRLHP
jgi:hypothetical protein